MTRNMEYYKHYLKIASQNAPDCISAHIHFKKFLGGGGHAVVSRVLSLKLISFPKNAGRRAACESCAEVLFLKKNRSTSLFPQRSAFCFCLYVFPLSFFIFWRITTEMYCILGTNELRRIFTNHKCTPMYECLA